MSGRFGGKCGGSHRRSAPREAEHALAHDGALDLVRARPDGVLIDRRQRESGNHASPSRRRLRQVPIRAHIRRDFPRLPRQIWTRRCPRLPSVRRLPYVLRRCVQNPGIGRRKNDRIRPLPPLLHFTRRFTLEHARIRIHLAQLSRAAIVSREKSTVVLSAEEYVEILRVCGDVPLRVTRGRRRTPRSRGAPARTRRSPGAAGRPRRSRPPSPPCAAGGWHRGA